MATSVSWALCRMIVCPVWPCAPPISQSPILAAGTPGQTRRSLSLVRTMDLVVCSAVHEPDPCHEARGSSSTSPLRFTSEGQKDFTWLNFCEIMLWCLLADSVICSLARSGNVAMSEEVSTSIKASIHLHQTECSTCLSMPSAFCGYSCLVFHHSMQQAMSYIKSALASKVCSMQDTALQWLIVE